MTKREWLDYHKSFCACMSAITQAKNADYTGTSDDPFANFAATEVVAGVSAEQGILVRMSDKMARIKSFAQKGILEVKDETVEDTLIDLANYAALLAGLIRRNRDRMDQKKFVSQYDKELMVPTYTDGIVINNTGAPLNAANAAAQGRAP